MKVIDIVALLILFALLFIASYILLDSLPGETETFQEYKISGLDSLSEKSYQFYSNMRYQDRTIGYSLDEKCSSKKRDDFERATNILEQRTILNFYKSERGEITVSCSNIAPAAEQRNHFVAGEGGPTEIINASKYAVILSGQISLYRNENCDEPKIALHELLHALGFDHNKNKDSIMYPITDCDQELDEYITNEINSLYNEPSFPDILIENLHANKSGRYLNFYIVAANYGFKKIDNSTLNLKIADSTIKSFEIGELDIGAKKSLTVSDLRIPRKTSEIVFEIITKEQELSKENNRVSIAILQ